MQRELDPARLGDHVDRLYRAALALTGSRPDAEDLVQETYVRVLARPRFLRGGDDIGYLLGVLRNVFLDQRRGAARRPADATAPEDLEAVAAAGAGSAQETLEAHEVLERIAALPGDLRDVVVAVDVAGLSYKQAAKALQIPEGTVMSRLYRARERVAAWLS